MLTFIISISNLFQTIRLFLLDFEEETDVRTLKNNDHSLDALLKTKP